MHFIVGTAYSNTVESYLVETSYTFRAQCVIHKNHKSDLDFWSYFPLIFCNAILCLLYNLITVRGISTKLDTCI